jgi:hypothetical protein
VSEYSAGGRIRRFAIGQVVEQGPQGQVAAHQPQPAVLDLGDLEQVFDEPQQLPAAALDQPAALARVSARGWRAAKQVGEG